MRPYGPDAVILVAGEDFDPSATTESVAGLWRDHPGVTDCVASESVVVITGPDLATWAPREWSRATTSRGDSTVKAAADAVEYGESVQTASASRREIEIPVVYDGEDLPVVAAATGLSVPEVIACHQQPLYTSAFCGFAPGFAYLSGLDPRLHVPRRDTPRARVAPGSVAIAGPYSAVYPSASPGGWHLLGRTSMTVWDPTRSDPALLAPGTLVRFVTA